MIFIPLLSNLLDLKFLINDYNFIIMNLFLLLGVNIIANSFFISLLVMGENK